MLIHSCHIPKAFLWCDLSGLREAGALAEGDPMSTALRWLFSSVTLLVLREV